MNLGSQGSFGLSESRTEIRSKRFGGVAIVGIVDGHAFHQRVPCDSSLCLLVAHQRMTAETLSIEWSCRVIELHCIALHLGLNASFANA